MAAVAILDIPKSLCIAFLTISDQYHNFYFGDFFLQNGFRRPFRMSENHFRSHLWPFQINAKFFLNIFKMAGGAHFGCPKFTFDRISNHFRSISNFFFLEIFIFVNFFTKCLPEAILDVRKSCSVAQHFWPFQNDYRQPFWISEIHFGSHFWPF